jgi:hypothetical protein
VWEIADVIGRERTLYLVGNCRVAWLVRMASSPAASLGLGFTVKCLCPQRPEHFRDRLGAFK